MPKPLQYQVVAFLEDWSIEGKLHSSTRLQSSLEEVYISCVGWGASETERIPGCVSLKITILQKKLAVPPHFQYQNEEKNLHSQRKAYLL